MGVENGWSCRSFKDRSGVCHGYPLSLLLYVLMIDPLFRRVDPGPLAGVAMDRAAPEAVLRVVAYVFVFLEVKVEWVMLEVECYSEASGSKINQEKCESL